jgi:hypothetical protein
MMSKGGGEEWISIIAKSQPSFCLATGISGFPEALQIFRRFEGKGVAFRPLVVDVFGSAHRIQSITSPAYVLLRRVNSFRPWLRELVSLFTGRSVLASSPGVTSLLSNRFFVNLSLCCDQQTLEKKKKEKKEARRSDFGNRQSLTSLKKRHDVRNR